MDLPQLTDDQLERVREFMADDASRLLWQQLEAGIMADWIQASTTEARERCWHELQAVLALQSKLHNAKRDKQLSERSQAARTIRTAGL
jgi:hypothetical protein